MPSNFTRLGPRPLALHAFAAWRAHLLAIAALGARDILDEATARRIAHVAADPNARLALTAALLAETGKRWGAFWEGVAKYRSHPYRRHTADRPHLWRSGNTRLIDFAPGSDAPPILAIPSLVNSSDVLDLLPKRSLMQGLAEAGFRPLLVDWGEPEPDAARWTIDRYVADRLTPMLAAIQAEQGQAPVLLGYCMGGLLATALATTRPQDVRALALLATPWDFHAPSPETARLAAGMAAPFQEAAAPTGVVPTDLLQVLFFALDPTLAARKFRRFATLEQSSDTAVLFTAMEDWVNGGPGLAAPVAETVLGAWYGENAVVRGLWRVGGRTVDNRSFTGPTLVAAPSRDRIVPPASARAYAKTAGSGAVAVLDVKGGHVGMIVGHGAKDELWRPLFDWLRATI